MNAHEYVYPIFLKMFFYNLLLNLKIVCLILIIYIKILCKDLQFV